MTKRPGRKRKSTPREPNGRQQRRPDTVILPESIAQRAIRFGVTITDARSIATASEALWHRGLLGSRDGIGRRRREILESYRALWVDWSGMCGSRRWRADQVVTGIGLDIADWRRCDDKMAACVAAIRRCDYYALVESVIETVCLDDLVPPRCEGRVQEALWAGCDALIAALGASHVPARARPACALGIGVSAPPG